MTEFVEFKKSAIWEHFLREKDGKSAQCKLCPAMLTIPPTSVEAERAFSSAGLLCTQLRLRLYDATVDTLCFLHSHYHDNN